MLVCHFVKVHFRILSIATMAGIVLGTCACNKSTNHSVAEPKSGKPTAMKKPTTKAPSTTTKYAFVKPDHVRGVYWTAFTAGSSRSRERQLAMIDRTELNSVVIDIRDSGQMYFKTGIQLATEAKANKIGVPRPEALMKDLEAHHVWPIARIACFRDSYVPLVHPEMAVHFKNGKLWQDKSRHKWLDPYSKKNWDYIAQTVDYALDIGFPEIQLDYVRFPSEGKTSTQVFPNAQDYAKTGELKEDVISDFVKFIAKRVHDRKAFISADVFGIISSTKGNEGIGQQLEKIAAPFDALSPMIYPSHFAKGEYRIANPNLAPYEIIKKSLTDYKKRLPSVIIRPWLQDFSLFGVHYGAEQVKAQIKAARDVGYQSFLLWNAGNHYTEAALGPKIAQTATTQ